MFRKLIHTKLQLYNAKWEAQTILISIPILKRQS